MLPGWWVPNVLHAHRAVGRVLEWVGLALGPRPVLLALGLLHVAELDDAGDSVTEDTNHLVERELHARVEVDRATGLHVDHELDHLHRVHALLVVGHLGECLEEGGLVLAELVVPLDTELELLLEKFLLGEFDTVNRQVREVAEGALGDAHRLGILAIVVGRGAEGQDDL